MKRIWLLPVAGGLVALIVYLVVFSFGLYPTAYDYNIADDHITISIEYNRALASAVVEDGSCDFVDDRKITCVVTYTPGTPYLGEIHVEDVEGREHTFHMKVRGDRTDD